MNIESTVINSLKDLYFTDDHEWIDFKGAIAYTGICIFKLLGFKEIQAITFHESSGFVKKGGIIATIRYNDYLVEAHMPVDGKILQINDDLTSGKYDALLLQPESAGWIAMIAPALPYERKGLLFFNDYRMKNKHAK